MSKMQGVFLVNRRQFITSVGAASLVPIAPLQGEQIKGVVETLKPRVPKQTIVYQEVIDCVFYEGDFSPDYRTDQLSRMVCNASTSVENVIGILKSEFVLAHSYKGRTLNLFGFNSEREMSESHYYIDHQWLKHTTVDKIYA
tara:strand:+ start:33584 stop:34009 length:426 start_codon:yes stop_codon:yes gene_type:complete